MSRPGFNFSIDSLIAPTLASRFGSMYGYFFMPPGHVPQVTSPSALQDDTGIPSSNFPFAHAAFSGHPYYGVPNPYYGGQGQGFRPFPTLLRKESESPVADSDVNYTYGKREFRPLSSMSDDHSPEPTDLSKPQSPAMSEKDEDEDGKDDFTEAGSFAISFGSFYVNGRRSEKTCFRVCDQIMRRFR